MLAVGVGIGGLATFGALLHLINNALAKGVLFLCAGNIHRAFASKRLSEVRGALTALPFSGALFLAGFLAVTGSPPFGMFLSEFTILRGIFNAGQLWVGAGGGAAAGHGLHRHGRIGPGGLPGGAVRPRPGLHRPLPAGRPAAGPATCGAAAWPVSAEPLRLLLEQAAALIEGGA